MKRCILIVPILLVALVASAGDFFHETFSDWAVIRTPNRSFVVKKSEYEAAYANQKPGSVKAYELAYTDTAPADSIQVVKVSAAALLKFTPAEGGGMDMEVSITSRRGGGTFRDAKRYERTAADNFEGSGLPALQGGWDRRIRIIGLSGEPVYNSDETLLASLPPERRPLAVALRDSMPAEYKKMIALAYKGEDVAPALDAVMQGYMAAETAGLRTADSSHPGREPRADVWGSLHAYERAVLSGLPSPQREALRAKIDATTSYDAGTALLGQLRKIVRAYHDAGAGADALTVLMAAAADPAVAAASMDGTAVQSPEAAPLAAAEAVSPPADVVPTTVGEEAAAPVQASLTSDPLPVPEAAAAESGGLLKNPLVAAAGGALIGALIGFMLAGPFGAAVGAAIGLGGGLLARQVFGSGGDGA